ncbi:hypothetical protein HNR40_001899 [Nonomuraea endophytica]|uniref:Uncharacterized protein n=1 Tax=Nonomuraea endophytica TaxID=714136 RepID=A0A7W8EDD2_9ACTN|nr:hypothetical protein [Nonomuraea endophytica]
MSLRWQINNKVQAVKEWFRPRRGRLITTKPKRPELKTKD